MVSKENFNKVWKDTSREGILNQFYYEHYELVRIQKEISEYIENMTKQFESFKDKELITNRVIDISVLEKILEILDKGE